MSGSTPILRRPLVRVAALSAALVALTALAVLTASAGAAHAASDQSLLKTYQPVLVFHPDELFRPTKVNSFVNDSRLEQFAGTSAFSKLAVDPSKQG